LNERDEDENTPIHVAIHCQKLDHVKLLCKAGASLHKKSDGSPPLHVAISMGAVPQHKEFAYECVRVLHKYDADLAAKDDALHTPLSLACMYNLPEIVSFILSTDAGLATVNARADRTQGRALHMAAKFDAGINGVNRVAATTVGHVRVAHVHHPDGSVVNAMHRIPGFPGKQADRSNAVSSTTEASSQETVTELLVKAADIEIDAQNSVGQTSLHVACGKGNWNVVRILLDNGASPAIADRRGFTPGQLAHKRGMPIPNDLLKTLGGPPSSGIIPPPRDLIVDPDNNTLLITHELCLLHRTCPPIRRGANDEPPPENVRRLHVLVDKETGILRSGEFGRCKWENEGRRAALVDVLKCHEYSYVETISQMCSSIPDHPSAVANLDADTTMSRWSFEAALRAAGSVCEAVDKVVAGDHRNAFCVVRPPGHHAGPRGIVRCDNDPDGGSHGFCFLNNVAIGAAYARSMYRNEGIQKIAIVDFDVHHGNGTEEIVRQLVPTIEKSMVRTPFAVGELATQRYRPWLDETDINNVFFASTHGYGPRGQEFAGTPSCGWFYPASGKSQISDAISNPSVVESPNLTDFLLSQTWTRMGDDAKGNCCKILNCGLGLPGRDAVPGMQRLEVRDTYRKKILPVLRDFDPDIIFVSAGFDAHKKDSMNFGYVGMVEDDYEWVTEQLVRLANTCCNGRIVSVLEGGYKIHGGIVSPFARSVASHVRALVDGGRSRELYDLQDGEWESQFERHLIDERERKRQQKLEKMRTLEAQSRRDLYGEGNGVDAGVDDNHGRKRKRNTVDYRQLYEQMKKEGFAA
jgi:acetoin utilization deacetylase AcuC-like enzyme/ankyrin repeat protein